MRFDFDPSKSAANLRKHGIDFVEAQRLWDDIDLLEIPARTSDEPRFLVIGRDSRVRVISVRRARPEEVALYEGEG